MKRLSKFLNLVYKAFLTLCLLGSIFERPIIRYLDGYVLSMYPDYPSPYAGTTARLHPPEPLMSGFLRYLGRSLPARPKYRQSRHFAAWITVTDDQNIEPITVDGCDVNHVERRWMPALYEDAGATKYCFTLYLSARDPRKPLRPTLITMLHTGPILAGPQPAISSSRSALATLIPSGTQPAILDQRTTQARTLPTVPGTHRAMSSSHTAKAHTRRISDEAKAAIPISRQITAHTRPLADAAPRATTAARAGTRKVILFTSNVRPPVLTEPYGAYSNYWETDRSTRPAHDSVKQIPAPRTWRWYGLTVRPSPHGELPIWVRFSPSTTMNSFSIRRDANRALAVAAWMPALLNGKHPSCILTYATGREQTIMLDRSPAPRNFSILPGLHY